MPQHFRKVADGFDVAPALDELWRFGARELEIDRLHCPGRDGAGIVHLFQNPKIADIGAMNARYVACHALLDQVAAALGDMELYVAALRILPPKARVGKHRDGFVPGGRKRFHLALQHDPGAYFVIANEHGRYKPGELWHVDLMNRPHFAVNNSERVRVIMLVDAHEAGACDATEVARLQAQYQQTIGPDWRQTLQGWARR